MIRKLDFKEEVKEVIENGRYFKGEKGLAMYILDKSDAGFGIITKKVKGGVKRNRLRRRVREILRRETSLEKGWLVLELNKESLNLTYLDIKQEIYKLIKKAELWQN